MADFFAGLDVYVCMCVKERECVCIFVCVCAAEAPGQRANCLHKAMWDKGEAGSFSKELQQRP